MKGKVFEAFKFEQTVTTYLKMSILEVGCKYLVDQNLSVATT